MRETERGFFKFSPKRGFDMEKQSGWQVIVVDWDTGQYAAVDPQADDDWDKEVAPERAKGRDIHWFHHDAEDTAGLRRWAEKKYKRLQTHKRFQAWWTGLLHRAPRLFTHWLVVRTY